MANQESKADVQEATTGHLERGKVLFSKMNAVLPYVEFDKRRRLPSISPRFIVKNSIGHVKPETQNGLVEVNWLRRTLDEPERIKLVTAFIQADNVPSNPGIWVWSPGDRPANISGNEKYAVYPDGRLDPLSAENEKVYEDFAMGESWQGQLIQSGLHIVETIAEAKRVRNVQAYVSGY